MSAVLGGTHYEVLEVGAGASEVEIKAAYRRLIRVWHPDLVGVDGEEVVLHINAAFRELGDAERRRAYDASLIAAAVEDVAEPVAPWGVADDDGWLDEIIVDGPDELVAVPGSRRARIWLMAVGWVLVVLGGALASTIWNRDGGLAPPPAAVIIGPLLLAAVLSASRIRGGSAGAWWWNAIMAKREPDVGSVRPGLLMQFGFGLLRVFIGGLGWASLTAIGGLSSIGLGLAVVSGALFELSWIAAAGLILAVVGGVVVRLAGAVSVWLGQVLRR